MTEKEVTSMWQEYSHIYDIYQTDIILMTYYVT